MKQAINMNHRNEHNIEYVRVLSLRAKFKKRELSLEPIDY